MPRFFVRCMFVTSNTRRIYVRRSTEQLWPTVFTGTLTSTSTVRWVAGSAAICSSLHILSIVIRVLQISITWKWLFQNIRYSRKQQHISTIFLFLPPFPSYYIHNRGRLSYFPLGQFFKIITRFAKTIKLCETTLSGNWKCTYSFHSGNL